MKHKKHYTTAVRTDENGVKNDKSANTKPKTIRNKEKRGRQRADCLGRQSK